MKKFILIMLLVCFPAIATTISISLKNAPTSELLSYLAEESGKNIVLTDNIESKTTLRLENSSFDEILNSIVKINQLALTKEKETYYLTHRTEQKNSIENVAKNSEKTTALPAINATPQPPKLITRTIKLHYAKASEVIESLTKGNGTFLSENGYIHFDDRSNSLIIKDSAASLKNIERLLKELDKPTEQIAIEARIVTISSENLQELGVRWGVFSPNESYHKFDGSLDAKGFNTNNLNVNFPVSNAASAVLQVATINSRVLDLELTALEQENSVEIIASPRLLTTNKKAASIKQGTEIPYAFYNSKSEISELEFKEAVLGLQVTPHLSKNNQLLLDLVVTQNSPNTLSNSNGLTTIDKQEINTQVFAKHGETIVLGGIFQHLKSSGEDRVPLLGSIPVIKHLFSQSRDKISKRELVIFVTPYVMKSAPIAPEKPNSSNKSRAK